MSCITRPLINVKIKYENAKMKLKLFQRCNNNFYTTYEKYHYTPCHPQPKAPLSSSTESQALRIGDLSPPVIPHLMRDPDKNTGFPFSRE